MVYGDLIVGKHGFPEGIIAGVIVPDLPFVGTVEEIDDAVLLDNMDLATLKAAVAKIAGRATTEASGGVTLETVRDIAETGVDLISVGALTHSAPNLDVGFDFEPADQ